MELSTKQEPLKRGSIHQVKVLGAICLIDQGELDWKILTINVDEARDKGIKKMEDYMRMNPGAV